MLFSIALLIIFFLLSFKTAPKERGEDAHIHGAGQIGLLAAIALFGLDYFTSYYYATGEMLGALHPYGLQKYGYIGVIIIAIANAVFGGLYMFSLGPFNEGGGSYTASMRYLKPGLSLIVAVVLIQDYTLTIVVSTLSGAGQLLSLANAYNTHWFWHFFIGASLAFVTWFITIRGRGESGQIAFTGVGLFFLLTITMAIGLFIALSRNIPAVTSSEPYLHASLGQAFYHMLTATMKGMVALSGLEAVSNGIQFFKNEDVKLVKWGKKKMPRFTWLWNFYGGKSGIGRFVQTSFLFYGGLTTLFLASFAVRFNVYDGTLGRTLVGNLAYIGFEQIPGGIVLFWAYQILAVILLAFASLTALQDAQATEWRDVAIGEIPEAVVFRDIRGTFTRSVTITFCAAVLIQFLVKGNQSLAVPYYGVGVFMPITIMGLAVRQHIKQHFTGRVQKFGMVGASIAAGLAGIVFIGQIVGKWAEGGWVVLISFSILAITAHALLVSPLGFREPSQIYRIVRDKARVKGGMAYIVEWQSLKMQTYRYQILLAISRFYEIFGIRRPVRYEIPVDPGDYDHAVHPDHPDTPSILMQYIDPNPK